MVSDPDAERSETRYSEDGRTEYEMGIPIPGFILPAESWTKTAIRKLPPEGPLDFESIFLRKAPVVLDLGCGNGRFVLSSAFRRPEIDHLGIDILPMVIRYATRRANQRGLSNTRFAVCGAYGFLDRYVATESIAEIHIYHPQPYHSPHDRKLRLLTPDFLALVHGSLQKGGQFVLQTDNVAYWNYLRETVSQVFDWTEQTSPWEEDPYGRSRREFISMQQGLPVFRAVCLRRDDWTEVALAATISQLRLPSFAASAENSAQARRRPYTKNVKRHRRSR